MIGRSVNAGVFPIDVCLLAYFVVHGLPALDDAIDHKALSTGVVALFGLSIVATYSGVFNFFFVDTDPLKFYAFTIAKFWEYALLGLVLIANRPDAAQLRKICATVLAGILVLRDSPRVAHERHRAAFGRRVFRTSCRRRRPQDVIVPFSDRTGWFLEVPGSLSVEPLPLAHGFPSWSSKLIGAR